MDLRVAFGAAVRAARLRRGWSQETIAEGADVDRNYVSGLERGQRNPTLLMQERIAGALQLPLSALVSDAESRMRRRR